jgi:hypothetical protein
VAGKDQLCAAKAARGEGDHGDPGRLRKASRVASTAPAVSTPPAVISQGTYAW